MGEHCKTWEEVFNLSRSTVNKGYRYVIMTSNTVNEGYRHVIMTRDILNAGTDTLL